MNAEACQPEVSPSKKGWGVAEQDRSTWGELRKCLHTARFGGHAAGTERQRRKCQMPS